MKAMLAVWLFSQGTLAMKWDRARTNYVVPRRGSEIRRISSRTVDTCKKECEDEPRCNNMEHCLQGGLCVLYTNPLFSTDEIRYDGGCTAYWKVPGNRVLAKMDCEVEDDGHDDKWGYMSYNEKVAWFDTHKGVDADGNTGYYRFSIGATWKYGKQNEDVITDVLLKAGTSCPRGYDRVCYWQPDGWGFTTNGDRVDWRDMSMCVKYDECTLATEAVTDIFAAASDKEQTAQSLDGATRIGYWDTGKGGSHSYRDGGSGYYNMAMYIKKGPCSSSCHSIKIGNLKKVGDTDVTKITAKKISQTQIVDNCKGSSPLSHEVLVQTSSSATSSSTMTVSKSWSNTFTHSVENSIEYTLEGNFLFLQSGSKLTAKMTASASRTWSGSNTDTTLTSETHTVNINMRPKVTVAPGKKVQVYIVQDAYNHKTQFTADAICKDENGVILETKQIEGGFGGTEYVGGGSVVQTDLPCPGRSEEELARLDVKDPARSDEDLVEIFSRMASGVEASEALWVKASAEEPAEFGLGLSTTSAVAVLSVGAVALAVAYRACSKSASSEYSTIGESIAA